MVFETLRDWECVSASKFAKIAAVSRVYLALVEQVGDLKRWLPVEYLSHRLSVAEQNYDATNREFVAILSALK